MRRKVRRKKRRGEKEAVLKVVCFFVKGVGEKS